MTPEKTAGPNLWSERQTQTQQSQHKQRWNQGGTQKWNCSSWPSWHTSWNQSIQVTLPGLKHLIINKPPDVINGNQGIKLSRKHKNPRKVQSQKLAGTTTTSAKELQWPQPPSLVANGQRMTAGMNTWCARRRSVSPKQNSATPQPHPWAHVSRLVTTRHQTVCNLHKWTIQVRSDDPEGRNPKCFPPGEQTITFTVHPPIKWKHHMLMQKHKHDTRLGKRTPSAFSLHFRSYPHVPIKNTSVFVIGCCQSSKELDHKSQNVFPEKTKKTAFATSVRLNTSGSVSPVYRWFCEIGPSPPSNI